MTTLEKIFRITSYAAVFCGYVALWVSGSFGVIATVLFIGVMIAAWMLEGSRWQISEKIGTALIVLALPVFYLGWRFNVITLYGGETMLAGILARMILALTCIKLLQQKSDRDWIFLYLMSFFEVLLAAGLSISAMYLTSFVAYLLLMVCAVIAFEIKKTSRNVELKIKGESQSERDPFSESQTIMPARRLPVIAAALIGFTALLAIPLFFMLPRVGGAGFGGNQGGLSTSSGFSDRVRLGGFGRINQNDDIVMRVRLEGDSPDEGGYYLRGIALDTFDNQTWSKSKLGQGEPFAKGDRELVQVDYAATRENLSVQTIYLEPLDTPVLFALPRAVAVQGSFPVIYKDDFGALSVSRSYERVSYKVLSDRALPSPATLRTDNQPYSTDALNYLSLPPIYDERIDQLASQLTSGSKNRYDKATAVESYLQTSFGYTLEQKAAGAEPLADFLFNVREGHCEYFATAMAVMLRTQGIATRVVNGFHGGEYNDAADVTVIRQRNAHAWVEVYFSKQNVWVPFDPTPAIAQSSVMASGFTGTINKYVEALETIWIQYFVAFDSQEQRSLARNIRDSVSGYRSSLAAGLTSARDTVTEWWAEVRGDKGLQTSLTAVGYGIIYLGSSVAAILLLFWLFRKLRSLHIWSAIFNRLTSQSQSSAIDFFERMQILLASRGVVRKSHQTPLEFAFESGMPEAMSLTEKYHQVRYGEKNLTEDERGKIELWLKSLDKKD